ncbi:MAG: hypothetical protein JWL64_1377 [Frankiales bacterium]|nr:hypothetical protein [Frankiales bacterium]
MRAAIVFGGPSPEHDVSILTGLQAERLLARAGVEVVPLYWTRTGEWFLCPTELEAADFFDGAPASATKLSLRLQPDPGFYAKRGMGSAKHVEIEVGLNCCHGGAGEGGPLHGVFDALGLPLSGGPAPLAALGMDKLAFGAVLRSAGIPTLDRVLVDGGAAPFDGPYIVKPRYGGSSIGIEIVADWPTAQALAQSSPQLRRGAVAEPFLDHPVDLNISFRTWPTFEVSLLERPLRPTEGFYTFADKYMQKDGLVAAPRELPAQVPDEITTGAADLAERVHRATGIRGLVRLDLLTHDGALYVNEINTIPGAMALYLWPDTDPSRLLLDVLEETRATFAGEAAATFEPGAALRAAGGISAKLGNIGQAR